MASIASGVWGGTTDDISQGIEYGFRPDWYQYTGEYGLRAGTHGGYDIVMPAGTRLYALSYGVVMPQTPGPGGPPSDSFRPRPVWIETKDDPSTAQIESAGWVEIYGHMSDDAVRAGQTVRRGQFIGVSGEQTVPGTLTPDGSGAHLHFELREPTPGKTPSGYTIVDPRSALESGNFTPTDTGTVPSSGGGGSDTFGVGALVGALQSFAAKLLFASVGVLALIIGVIAITRNEPVGRTLKRAATGGKKAALLAAL